jgi:Fe2+ or Zn2+ uptake regulation protein
MNYKDVLTEDRRLVILRTLAQAPGYSANDSILHAVLEGFGHSVSRDTVCIDLAWLAEQNLIQTSEVASVVIAKVLRRGTEAATGVITVPGVKKPSAGA